MTALVSGSSAYTPPVKVAFIQGSLIHARHTRIYEGFDPRYKMVAVGSKVCDIGESDLGMESIRLKSTRDITRRIPHVRNRIRFGRDQYFYGFEDAMSDMGVLFPGSAACRYSYQSVLLKRKTGAKVAVMELDNVPLPYYQRDESGERALVLAEADALVATTHQVKQCLLLEGVPEDKIEVIWFGIRTDIFKPGPKDPSMMQRLGLSENDIVILFVGQFSWRKNPFDLLYAAKCFALDQAVKDAPVKFVLLGSGDLQALRDRAEWLGVADRVIIQNSVPYEQMLQVYRCADIVTVPSVPTPTFYEQGSCVMLEAMGTGKTLVISESGAMPELLGDAGFSVPAADYYRLYEVLKQLVLNDKMREDYGLRARTRACECLDASITCEQTAKLFDRLLG